jgi:hypothetical protein
MYSDPSTRNQECPVQVGGIPHSQFLILGVSRRKG